MKMISLNEKNQVTHIQNSARIDIKIIQNNNNNNNKNTQTYDEEFA